MSREILDNVARFSSEFSSIHKTLQLVIVVQAKTYLVGIIRYWGRHSDQLVVYYFLWIALYIYIASWHR